VLLTFLVVCQWASFQSMTTPTPSWKKRRWHASIFCWTSRWKLTPDQQYTRTSVSMPKKRWKRRLRWRNYSICLVLWDYLQRFCKVGGRRPRIGCKFWSIYWWTFTRFYIEICSIRMKNVLLASKEYGKGSAKVRKIPPAGAGGRRSEAGGKRTHKHT